MLHRRDLATGPPDAQARSKYRADNPRLPADASET
jgi:hypothetical protein